MHDTRSDPILYINVPVSWKSEEPTREPLSHTTEEAPMDVKVLTFAFVIVALGIGTVIVYLRGR